jgi:hypothetical protein
MICTVNNMAKQLRNLNIAYFSAFASLNTTQLRICAACISLSRFPTRPHETPQFWVRRSVFQVCASQARAGAETCLHVGGEAPSMVLEAV